MVQRIALPPTERHFTAAAPEVRVLAVLCSQANPTLSPWIWDFICARDGFQDVLV